MCGRYVVHHEEFALTQPGRPEPVRARPPRRGEVRPTDTVAVVALIDGAPMACLWRWGWSVPWQRGPLLNARAETLATRPAFRVAARRARCLVPASGWVEWLADGGRKVPHLFARADGLPLWFAGLWQALPDGRREVVLATRAADPQCAAIHDRMPVCLPPAAWAMWLATGDSPPPPDLLGSALTDCWTIEPWEPREAGLFGLP